MNVPFYTRTHVEACNYDTALLYVFFSSSSSSHNLDFVLMHTKVLYWIVEYMIVSFTWELELQRLYHFIAIQNNVCTIQWPKHELLLGTYFVMQYSSLIM